MRQKTLLSYMALAFALCFLGGCEEMKRTAPADYTIKVEPKPNKGLVAVPPECATWHDAANGSWVNTAPPQLGCATARNLATMVENPSDLVEGRQMGATNGVVAAGAVHNYVAGKTKALIDPNKKEPVVYNFNNTNPGSGSNN